MKRPVETLDMGADEYGAGKPVFPEAVNSAVSVAISPETAAEIDGLLAEVSETESSRERILGDYEYLPFRPDSLVSLSQIRGERNIVTDELKGDILYQGLINPVDVSLVSRDLLEEYVLFTNSTWGSETSIEDYLHLQLPDGRFPLLKSGHSRTTAIAELIAEGKLSEDTRIMTKVSVANGIFDIVQWQRGENIHSQPPRERVAMALVESYTYGLNNGLWHNEAEFIDIQSQQGRTIAKGPLDHALKYSRLAPRIRNFILAGDVPYLAGVEMGATMEVLAEYVARTNGYDGQNDPRLSTSPDRLDKLRKVVELEMDRICNRITGENLNSTASQKVVQAKRNAWAGAIKSMRQPKKGRDETVLHFEFADDALDNAVAAAERALKRELSETKSKYAGHDIPAFLKLQQGILPEKDVQELLASFEEELVRTRQALGSYTATVVAYESDLFGE